MPPSILLIDNYDSFVFNLARYFEELGVTTEVVRNDAITVDEIRGLVPDAIVLSPGPCSPAEAGVSVDIVQSLGDRFPILGVCLGHQAVASAYGGNVVRAGEPVHGRTSMIRHNGGGLFAGCENPLRVTRYHSLIIEERTLPECLEITAKTRDGIVMAFAHRQNPVYGVQFHPEAILTRSGHRILSNFLLAAGFPVKSSEESQEFCDVIDHSCDFYARAIPVNVPRPM